MEILAVDDEEMGLELLTDLIRQVQLDVDIHAFLSPVEAFEYGKTHPVDVAFLDIDMPVINGITLAKNLKKYLPKLNIIFETGYSQYSLDAFGMGASGYLLKPVTAEAVAQEFQRLRFPVADRRTEIAKQGIRAVTFGDFQLLVDGKPVHFEVGKGKEALAYLIDRKGVSANRKEIAAAIFEDKEYSRSTQDYLQKAIRSMTNCLKAAGAEQILEKGFNSYSVDIEKFTCDRYEYDAGVPQAISAFQGRYMSGYTWSENTLGRLYE